MTITIDQFVSREVLTCASQLISSLSSSEGPLQDQALELYYSHPDYESAAKEEGWVEDYDNEGYDCFVYTHEDGDKTYEYEDSWEDLCDSQGIEPYQDEVFEHWIVTPWLGEKLQEQGEVVDTDFAGLTIWGRTTTGQAIQADCVIKKIYNDLRS